MKKNTQNIISRREYSRRIEESNIKRITQDIKSMTKIPKGIQAKCKTRKRSKQGLLRRTKYKKYKKKGHIIYKS